MIETTVQETVGVDDTRLRSEKMEVMRWAPVEMVKDGMVAVRRGKRWERGRLRGRSCSRSCK